MWGWNVQTHPGRPISCNLRSVCSLQSFRALLGRSTHHRVAVLIAWMPAWLRIFHSARTGTTQPRLPEG